LVKENESRIFTLNLTGLIFAFTFLVLGLGASIYLILHDCTIAGSIFTGLTLIMGAALLAGRKTPSIKTPSAKSTN
jgi:hypothetical protein